jgi:itaconate CoA-transferase
MTNQPLSGLTVIAIEQAVAAPMCTVRLADAGARVIKIERPEGETARNYDRAVKGTSAYFAWLNRGKESAVLDLKAKDDRAILETMLGGADVLVQNLTPGALDRLGLTPAYISEHFPRLISVSILGYGQDTAYADMKAYDMLVQAESGLCAVTGTPETPSKIGVSAADIATGMNAHAAILEAVIARALTGKGRSIEVSMFDSIADWMAVPLLHFEHQGTETGRFGLSHASIYPYRPFACRDGTVIVAVQTNKEWARLCENVLGRPDLTTQAEFINNADRVRNRAALDAEVEPIFAAKSTAEMIDALKAGGIAYARYTSVAELPDHPALRRMNVTLPNGEVVTLPRPAARTSDFETKPVPGLGEHTDAIRSEFGKT